jgi:hypothetical protein
MCKRGRARLPACAHRGAACGKIVAMQREIELSASQGAGDLVRFESECLLALHKRFAGRVRAAQRRA